MKYRYLVYEIPGARINAADVSRTLARFGYDNSSEVHLAIPKRTDGKSTINAHG